MNRLASELVGPVFAEVVLALPDLLNQLTQAAVRVAGPGLASSVAAGGGVAVRARIVTQAVAGGGYQFRSVLVRVSPYP